MVNECRKLKQEIATPSENCLNLVPTIGACATLACIWEATAAKPGNVYRGADFDDLTYADFLTSAAMIGPIIDRTPELGVGATVLAAVEATRAAVATNTNLGMLLLIAPLAAAEGTVPLAVGIPRLLAELTERDTEHVYAAIRVVQPGGLGKVDEADVNAAPPAITLTAAMQLAADRDLVARQYANDFADVFWLADGIQAAVDNAQPLNDAIILAYLELLARQPDTLIARKCGLSVAEEASAQAAAVLAAREHSTEAYRDALADFDFWLRADAHRRNPGTSADLIAAALFVLLREGRLNWPVRFYN